MTDKEAFLIWYQRSVIIQDELNKLWGAEKKKRITPLNDDEKIELACQLNKLWIKEK